MLKKVGFALIWSYIKSFLVDIAEAVWDGLWEVIFQAIAEAEKKWEEGDLVKDKKQFVIDEAIKFIEDQKKLGWIRTKLIKLFLNTVIDRIITELNDKIGKDWIKQVKAVEDELDDFLPFE